MEREKIITLLAEDIKHNSLINGLESIGLSDNDRYTLKLDIFIAKELGYNQGQIPDAWLDVYQATMMNIPPNISNKEAHSQAEILYQSLSTI